MNNQTQTAIEAINHLARTERGRQALAILADLHDVGVHLDNANSEALRTVVEVMTSHQLNGTISDLLNPYESQ